MSKRKLSLRRLFSNTKFLIVFSLVVAFIFWIAVALEYAPIIEREIENVPVVIDMENSVPNKFDLQIFGQQEFTVDITVKGSRFIVGGDLLTADDFDVTAQTAYVNSAGNHTLQIKATKKDAEADYDIVKLSAEYVEVYFDKYDEKEIGVEPRIVTDLPSVTDNGYMFDENDILMPVSTLKISGAKSEIDNIQKAYADINIDHKLTESFTVDAPVSYEMELYDDIRFVTVENNNNTIPVTIPVYKIENLTTEAEFKNIPSDLISNPLSSTVIPSSVRAAVLQNGSNNNSVLNIGTIDFAEISDNRNTFELSAEDIPDVKMLDGTKSFSVKVDMSGYKAVKFPAEDEGVVFTEGDREKFSFDLSSLGSVTVIGKSASLSKLSTKNILVSVDTKKFPEDKNTELIPVTVSLKDCNDCWVHGSYKMKITKN